MEPDIFQGIGGMVDVLNIFKTREAIIGVIQGNINRIVYLLLPVIHRIAIGLAESSIQ